MSISDAFGLINDFAEDVVLHRFASGTYTAGIYVPGAETLSTIRGSVQPLTTDELLLLPEGQRSRGSFKVYTSTELFTARESGKRKADQLDIRGVLYEVQDVQSWQYDFTFWKAVSVKVNT